MNIRANGPGKYDALATMVRELSGARGVLVLVLGGERGDGFSVQLEAGLVQQVDIPQMLRTMADQIAGGR